MFCSKYYSKMETRKALCPRHEKNHIIIVNTIIYAKNKLLIIINTSFDEVQTKYLRIFFWCICHIIFVSLLGRSEQKPRHFICLIESKSKNSFLYPRIGWAGFCFGSIDYNNITSEYIIICAAHLKRMGIQCIMVLQPTQLSYFLLLSWLKVF